MRKVFKVLLAPVFLALLALTFGAMLVYCVAEVVEKAIDKAYDGVFTPFANWWEEL